MTMDEEKADEAFRAYAEAKKRVDRTLDLQDGRIAARAWVHFLNIFLEPDRQFPETNVVEFPKQYARQR